MVIIKFRIEKNNYIKYKIWYYRFCLKVLRDAKKDETLEEALRRIFCITPKFHKNFLNYYSRKHKRHWRNEFNKMNLILTEINKK